MKAKRMKQIIFSEILLISILFNIDNDFILAFMSIVVHEFSHIIMAKRKGSKFNNLQFHIYGSKVELMDLEELTSKDKFIIYIAGAVSNFVLVAIFKVLFIHTEIEIFETIARLNMGLAIFNLLPAYPLDGARVLELIVGSKTTYKKAQSIIAIISYVIAVFFILTPIITMVFKGSLNISMLIVGVIIIDITRSEKKAAMYILIGNMFKKRNNIKKNGYIENRSISVYYKLGLVKLMTYVDKNRFGIFYILNEELKIIYILNEDELIEALKVYGNISLEEYVQTKSNTT